jgi:hypothetical protein
MNNRNQMTIQPTTPPLQKKQGHYAPAVANRLYRAKVN